jgi:hypothetical protein
MRLKRIQDRLLLDMLRMDKQIRDLIARAKKLPIERKERELKCWNDSLPYNRQALRETQIECRSFLEGASIHLKNSARGLFLKCDKCGATWSPLSPPTGKRFDRKNYWRCPQGCNADHPALS